MASSVPISAITNQSLNIVLSNQNCTINLLTRNKHVFIDLFLNNVNIIYGRKLSITPVLSYPYLQSIFTGNFILINNDGNTIQEPDYRLFGITQSLIYYTNADINGSSS